MGSGLMHNKFAIIDGKILLTGSFNWTLAADQKNEENLLIIEDRKVIKAYQKRFEYLYRRSGKALNFTATGRKANYDSHRYFSSGVKYF